MRLALLPSRIVSPVSLSDADGPLDDLSACLMFVCEALHQAGASFSVSVGPNLLPVDVLTDLPVLLEQFDRLLGAVTAGGRVELYEQGVEAVLNFESLGTDLLVTCKPLSADGPQWVAVPIRCERAMLFDEIVHFWTAFLRLCREVCPEWMRLSVVAAWVESIDSEMKVLGILRV
jgi:hypothetical protein